MSVERSELANGLTVVSHAMPEVETVSLGLWIGAGSRSEAHTEHGVAHFLEHMAFKGTKRRSARDIAEEIEAVGGHLNAYTAREQTTYYARVMQEDVPLGIDILADIIQHSAFADNEMERERQVIIQELGQVEDTPDDLVFDLLQETTYPGQTLGRPILGTNDSVGGMSSEQLRHFIGAHYGPHNLVFTAGGAVEHDRIVEMVSRAFDTLPSGGASLSDAARFAGGDRRDS
ncbi:M16 family metallopeptidase, partial [Methyloceanibacter sp.]|uniref:M16 family metallopeptidase n=1 Tax=Methyloceanibacter sp. TaxID=1965321 RepID=UPI00351B533E